MIKWQRCFKIPKDKLDLFLVKITFSQGEWFFPETKYIFQNCDVYDVIVQAQNTYLSMQNDIEKFAKDLNVDKKGN